MTLFRILTEDINRATVEGIVNARFPGYTILPSIGYWKGSREYSMAIEIIAEDSLEDRAAIADIAQNIKRANSQESVMIQQFDVASFLV